MGWPVPLRQFVLKVHSRCDLACDHCYVYQSADQSWRGRGEVQCCWLSALVTVTVSLPPGVLGFFRHSRSSIIPLHSMRCKQTYCGMQPDPWR